MKSKMNKLVSGFISIILLSSSLAIPQDLALASQIGKAIILDEETQQDTITESTESNETIEEETISEEASGETEETTSEEASEETTSEDTNNDTSEDANEDTNNDISEDTDENLDEMIIQDISTATDGQVSKLSETSENDFVPSSWDYTTDEANSTITINKFIDSDERSRDVVIPSKIIIGDVTYTTVKIAPKAFKSTSITSIVFKSINDSKVIFPEDCSKMFYDSMSLKYVDLSGANTSNATNMNSMFLSCWSLQNINFSGFDTSNVINIGAMFSECKSLEQIDLSSFDTRNVTDMHGMFYGCRKLVELDLSNISTESITDVDGIETMFALCDNLRMVNLTGKFDISKIEKSPSMMFFGFSTQPLLVIANNEQLLDDYPYISRVPLSVKFDANGGVFSDGTSEKSKRLSSVAVSPDKIEELFINVVEEPTREDGYVFQSWHNDWFENLINSFKPDADTDNNISFDQNLTFVAQWGKEGESTTKPTESTTKETSTQSTTTETSTESTTTETSTESTTRETSTQSTTRETSTQSTTRETSTESTTRETSTQSTTRETSTESTTRETSTESTTRETSTESTTRETQTESTTRETQTESTTNDNQIAPPIIDNGGNNGGDNEGVGNNIYIFGNLQEITPEYEELARRAIENITIDQENIDTTLNNVVDNMADNAGKIQERRLTEKPAFGFGLEGNISLLIILLVLLIILIIAYVVKKQIIDKEKQRDNEDLEEDNSLKV